MTDPAFLWAPGSVTGIGSLPGTDPGEAAALVLGELPDLPHLPELPARGPGSQTVGRAASLLVDLPVEIVPSGWRIAAHAGRDLRTARDDLARDLDALEEHAQGYTGTLKVQVAGPWTLAAGIELAGGHAMLVDPGAIRDLVASLAEGVRLHLADVGARVPKARVLLQLDEPSLPTVLAGRVPTASGYGTVRAVDVQLAEQGLRDVLGVAAEGRRVVHCCAPDAPLPLLRAAGADALALDLDHVHRAELDALGEAVDAGVSLWLGVVQADATDPSGEVMYGRLRELWNVLGFAPEALARSVVATPACGLAGSSPARVRRILKALRETGARMVDAQN